MHILYNDYIFSKEQDEEWSLNEEQEYARMDVEISDNNGETSDKQENTPPPEFQNSTGPMIVQFADTGRAECTAPERDNTLQAALKITESGEQRLAEYAKPRNEGADLLPEAATEDVQSSILINGTIEDVPRSLENLQLPLVSFQELEFCELAYRKLGSGLDTAVYRGLFRGVQRHLAVTQYSRVTADDDVLFKEAANQSRILIHIEDTDLAPTFVGIMQDHPDGTHSTCLVQELETDMSTLKLFLGDRGISEDTWLDIAVCIAKAVKALHLKCVLHNNVNPNTIKVQLQTADQDMKIQLMEFGRSSYNAGYRYEDDPDRLSRIGHLAPEVKAGHATSPASDVYSLGAILSDINQVAAIPGLDDVASMCMRKNTETRPAATTVVEMLQTVKEQLKSEDF